MREEIIKAIEEYRLGDYIVDNYNDMPMKTVRRLLILLADYIKTDHREELIYDINKFYHEDFE